TLGSCVFKDCVSGSTTAFGSCGDRPPTAGPVSFTGGLVPLSLAPAANGCYDVGPPPPAPTDTLLFVGGETLTVSAPGAEVPAFSIPIVTPTAPTVTKPQQ